MLVELVQTVTADGVRLDGSWAAPQGAKFASETELGPSHRPVEAWILVHGTGGSFYSTPLLTDLAERFLAAGAAVLRVNTRGFGLVNGLATRDGSTRGGAAYETLDDCRQDLAAWIGFAVRRGAGRIGLLGHSSGAVKVLYSQSYEPQPAVERLIAVSPPRLSYSWFLEGGKSQEFRGLFQEAADRCSSGRGGELIDVRFPLPLLITAEGYVEKYGPEERYNFLRFVQRLRRPALFTFGEREVAGNAAFQGLPEATQAAQGPRGAFTVETIAGADHFYTGVWDRLAARIGAWLGPGGISEGPAAAG